MGREIYLAAPPMPSAQDGPGETLYTLDDLQTGREVWQTTGGQESARSGVTARYVAPDWSADWLHREAHRPARAAGRSATTARRSTSSTMAAGCAAGASCRTRCARNTYDPATGDRDGLRGPRRRSIAQVAEHYKRPVRHRPRPRTRCARSTRSPHEPDPGSRSAQAMTAFFFWASWAGVDEPPGRYGHLHQQLAVRAAGRQRADRADLLVDVRQHRRDARRHRRAGVVLRHECTARTRRPVVPDSDPLQGLQPTPSMRATLKYFWVVAALIVVQVGLGGITAHYGVEGQASSASRSPSSCPTP